MLLLLPDPRGAKPSWTAAARAGLAEVAAVVRRLPANPAMLRFLIARLFYTDGLNTLFAFGAIFAAGVFGLGFEEILLFGIALNLTAGLGAAGFGLIEDRVGLEAHGDGGAGALVLFGGGLLVVEGKPAFWALALALGVFIGPAQAASRDADGEARPGRGGLGAFRAVRAERPGHRLPRPGGAGDGDGGDRQPAGRDGDGAGLPRRRRGGAGGGAGAARRGGAPDQTSGSSPPGSTT